MIKIPAPSIAVVIPVYKQPQYLKDAVLSVVRQSVWPHLRTVIVNDGCPYPTTDLLGHCFRDAFPDQVYYLRKSNGGLASARNAGVRFALAAWPSIQAVFPLDADNMLSPTTLEKLWEILSSAPDDVGWIYQDLSTFGQLDVHVPMTLPFSLYRLTEENYSDAGSLIRSRLFETGNWYDETMTGWMMGYEDWDLFLNAGLHGFRGVPARDTGFLYRKRGHSMVDDAKVHHETIYDHMRTKYRSYFRHNDLAWLEHRELPRFALVNVEANRVSFFTSPSSSESTSSTISEYVDRIAAWHHTNQLVLSANRRIPDAPYIPPITLFAYEDECSALHRLGLMPGILYLIQRQLRQVDLVTITFDIAEQRCRMHIAEQTSAKGKVILLGMRSQRLIDLAKRGNEDLQSLAQADAGATVKNLELSLGYDFVPGFRRGPSATFDGVPDTGLMASASRVLRSLSTRLAAQPEPAPSDDPRPLYGPPPHTEFAAHQQLAGASVSFPYCVEPNSSDPRPLNIFFVVPWVWIGGVDRCVQCLARELRRRDESYRLHLLVTSSPSIEALPEHLEGFHTTSLIASSCDVNQSLLDILSAADVVINAHSFPCYEAFRQSRFKNKPRFMSYLHVVEPLDHERPGGHPFTATREFSNVIDDFLVVSEQLKRTCKNFGIPEEKLLVIPNAPAVAPASVESAVQIARAKSARRHTLKTPLRLLFIGRFDRQKGYDRLQELGVRLADLGLPVQLEAVGKPVLSGSIISAPGPHVRSLGPVYDSPSLASYYTDADVVLLPSRWEGAPLTALEGMAFGNIVIATDVGAIRELVEPDQTGFLLDPAQSEESLLAEMSAIIANVVKAPAAYEQLRLAACKRGMQVSWAESASRLASLIELSVGRA